MQQLITGWLFVV